MKCRVQTIAHINIYDTTFSSSRTFVVYRTHTHMVSNSGKCADNLHIALTPPSPLTIAMATFLMVCCAVRCSHSHFSSLLVTYYHPLFLPSLIPFPGSYLTKLHAKHILISLLQAITNEISAMINLTRCRCSFQWKFIFSLIVVFAIVVLDYIHFYCCCCCCCCLSSFVCWSIAVQPLIHVYIKCKICYLSHICRSLLYVCIAQSSTPAYLYRFYSWPFLVFFLFELLLLVS